MDVIIQIYFRSQSENKHSRVQSAATVDDGVQRQGVSLVTEHHCTGVGGDQRLVQVVTVSNVSLSSAGRQSPGDGTF